MFRKLAKPLMLGALALTLTLSFTSSARAQGTLCNQDANCSDNGCAASGGACGALTKSGPCICFYG